MATGTVADEGTERKRELAETSREGLAAAMAQYAAAELAASDPGEDGSHDFGGGRNRPPAGRQSRPGRRRRRA